ncbi:hypothetical protein CXG81DRAFT_24338 [Caulochytrium protostelioides]|uniref:MSP domain-containing protein n=1 Tax=Caulochytrium protostelioides TaxID=1555241 RepID=A0A4P9XC60_9FUNG|nr:hypothetical protein CXG81DRAFT_24338 [Caulochytrium protostelioides]|eukprot:RKP03027.1 hypothetical protein CXG81DRAFT_24338 [Caulochytrium protostelioides]
MTNSPSLLSTNPACFEFFGTKSGGSVSKLTLKNDSKDICGYKLKTNAAQRYSVHPVLGHLRPGESVDVRVRTFQPISAADRFMIQTTILSASEADTLDSTKWRQIAPSRIVETIVECKASKQSDADVAANAPLQHAKQSGSSFYVLVLAALVIAAAAYYYQMHLAVPVHLAKKAASAAKAAANHATAAAAAHRATAAAAAAQ